MKRFTAIAAALTLSAGSAFAGQDESKQPATSPVQMTDAQLDSVAAGLVVVNVSDVIDVNNNDVAISVQALQAVAVGVAVLSNQAVGAVGEAANRQIINR